MTCQKKVENQLPNQIFNANLKCILYNLICFPLFSFVFLVQICVFCQRGHRNVLLYLFRDCDIAHCNLSDNICLVLLNSMHYGLKSSRKEAYN